MWQLTIIASIELDSDDKFSHRSRLRGMHDHSLAHQGGGLGTLGGAGQTFYEQRQKLLQVL